MFEIKLRPNKNGSMFGSCTCKEILASSPFLLGYDISTTHSEQGFKVDELNLYFDSLLNKQITKQYVLSMCYKESVSIDSKL